MENKVAYITGGSKGIGLGIAVAMMEQGMRVAISGRNQAALDEAAKTLDGVGKGAYMTLQSDVRKMEDEQKAVDAILAKWGQLDVCIANAGVGKFVSIDEMDAETWHSIIDTNLTGVFNTVKACIPSLKKSEGYIITIASLAGTNFFQTASAYNASKFGLVGFTQAIMLDLRPHGIKVSTVMPGSVSTYFNNHQPSAEDAWKIQPEDLGQIVVDLLRMHPRTLPSKVEVRPSIPPSARK